MENSNNEILQLQKIKINLFRFLLKVRRMRMEIKIMRMHAKVAMRQHQVVDNVEQTYLQKVNYI